MKRLGTLFLAGLLCFGLCTACSQSGKSVIVSTDGSTSMEKVIGTLSEAFHEDNDNITVTYNPTGSSAGIQAVSEGRTDIGLSSRLLTDEEKADGLAQSILAYDGIAVIVNKENPVTDLSLDQIAAIFTGEVTNWSEAGGSAAPIVVIGREAGSGTRDGFESIAETEGECAYRQELTSTGDVITTVSQNPDAIGYASLASVGDEVRMLAVDGVTPSNETIGDGTYRIQRPFIFVTRNDQDLPSAAQEFIAFCLASPNLILKAGVVPAS